MAAIILGQVRAHPHGRASRGVPRDQPGPPPQLWSPSARGRWPSITVPTPREWSAGGLEDCFPRRITSLLPSLRPSTRPAQVRFPAQATRTATLGEVEADDAVRYRERGPGGPPCLARIRPRAGPGARAPGLRALRLRKPGEADRSALAANSSAVRPPSWACSVRSPRRRPPLGSSRSRAVGARTPAAASRRRPPPPDSGKLRGVPRALPEATDALLIKSNPIPPIPTLIMEAAAAGVPLPRAPAH